MRRLLAALALLALALTACTSSGTMRLGGTAPGTPAASTPAPAPSTPAPASGLPPSVSPVASAPPLQPGHDPGRVTGTLAGPCHYRGSPPDQLPDPSCTPGGYDPAVTAAMLCAKWYTTKSYRPPPSDTARFKYDVAEPAYGEHDAQGELDHLIPLELGGNNDASNLWPEPGKLPNLKDSVEGKLHIWVCAAPSAAERQGRLEAAQQAIAADWVTALQVLGVGGT